MSGIEEEIEALLKRLPPGTELDDDMFQMLAEQAVANINTRPIDDFAGLTSEQMYQCLYNGIEGFPGFALQRERTLSEFDLHNVPFVAMFYALAAELGEAGLKLTPQGRLPRRAVLAMHDIETRVLSGSHDCIFTPRLEEDCAASSSARAIYQAVSLIRVQKGKMVLTRKGKKMAQPTEVEALFWLLFDMTVAEFNWGYCDAHNTDIVVQHSFVFQMWLHAKNTAAVPYETFLAQFHRAFPIYEQTDINALKSRVARVFQWLGVLEFSKAPSYFSHDPCTVVLSPLGRALYA